MLIVGYGGITHKDLLRVTAVNRGDAPTTITNLCLLEYSSAWARWRHKPRKSFVITNPQLPGYTQLMPYILNVGEQWSGFAPERDDVTGDIQTGVMFAAIFTTDRDRPYTVRIPKRKPDKLAGATQI